MVLLVDDNDAIITCLEDYLLHSKVRCAVAKTSEAAMEIAQKNSTQIAAAIVNLQLERESGVELVRQLRSLLPRLPVIFSSGRFPRGAELAEFETERTGFLPKPYSLEQLGQLLRSITLGLAVATAPSAHGVSVSAGQQPGIIPRLARDAQAFHRGIVDLLAVFIDTLDPEIRKESLVKLRAQCLLFMDSNPDDVTNVLLFEMLSVLTINDKWKDLSIAEAVALHRTINGVIPGDVSWQIIRDAVRMLKSDFR